MLEPAHAANPAPATAHAGPTAQPSTAPALLPSVVVQPDSAALERSFEGTIEAVRQTQIAAQVAGSVVQRTVQAGDRVQAGQVLLRIDARAAEQGALASEAQVAAARAQRDVAQAHWVRQRQLYAQQFIARAALDQAQAQAAAAEAALNAQVAQARAVRTQSSWHTVTAPFAGVVSATQIEVGDMALPGRTLLTLHDPAVLRVTAQVPRSALNGAQGLRARVWVDGLAAPVQATHLEVLPAVDPATLSQTVRALLPAGTPGLPGTFARLSLQGTSTPATEAASVLRVPRSALLRRAELVAVYVLDDQGRPLLRQVRLGPQEGERQVVLSGLSAGERVVIDARRVQHGGR